VQTDIFDEVTDNNHSKKDDMNSITNVEQIKELWSKTYNTKGKPDWSHILPYYDDNIFFRDSIQQINGIDDFRAMTERLTKRSKDLKMKVVRAIMEGSIIFVEWEMTIKYKKNPSSVLYGSSRLTLNEEGMIIEQRDYYDLWGDIFDNIPRFGKVYRRFMIRKFG
jgi:ketosteroid isomerase-like protein